jgi:uracil-DNA glycosylase family 4
VNQWSPRRVPGIGPLDAKIVIVGEAPGADEDTRGEPFVGGSGQLLNRMLNNVGLDRSQIYITNVVKNRPNNNNFEYFYEDPACRQPSQFLRESIIETISEIQRINPNVVIPLGNESLRALVGKFSISSWRGSILSSPVGKCVPTLHPAYVLRQYESKPIVELDLKRAAVESATRTIDLPSYQFDILPTYDRVMEYLHEPHETIAFDIETTGRMVRCLGLSSRQGHAISIPFITSPQGAAPLAVPGSPFINFEVTGQSLCSHWSPDNEYEILAKLYDLFSNRKIRKIAHNFPFDSVVLAREFGFTSFPGFWMDTMSAWHCCYAEFPKGLDFLTSILTRVPYYSDYDASNDRETARYNCYDSAITFEIAPTIEQKLRDVGQDNFYFTERHPAIMAYTRAETRGIRVDEVKRLAQSKTVGEEIEQILYRIRSLAGGDIYGKNRDQPFNPRSWQHKQELLYGRLALPKQFSGKKDKDGNYNITTDKHAIAALDKKAPQYTTLFQDLLLHSEKATLKSSFLDKPLGADGRIRTHYNPAGTKTDRLASSEPLFDVGTNLQNLPRGEFRAMFLSDPGWTLIKADLSQAEFREVVWDARIHRIIKLYENPEFDVHRWNAAVNIFNVPEDQVTKQQRKVAKDGVYGGNYSMHYRKAAIVYKMPVETAKFVLDRYRAAVPEVPNWWKTIQHKINTTRCIEGPLGRKRYFFGRFDDDTYREAYSHSAQHVVAQLINRAFSLANELMPEQEAYPLLQVHDEICVMAKGEPDSPEVLRYAKLLKRLMEYPIKYEGVEQPLVIPAEVSVGLDWYNQKRIA